MNSLNISQSSLAEVGYCVHVARRLGYLSEKKAKDCDVAIRQAGAPLAGLIRSERTSALLRAGSAVALFLYVLARLS